MGVLAQLTAWEAGNLWRISWASILITLFSFTLSLMTQMFVGHLGELEPAGASISNIDIQGLPYGVNAPITGTGTFFFMKRWNRDFQIMLGLSYAASIRVGNELGAGHPKVARFSVIVVVMPSITFSVFVTLLVIILSTLYTSSTTVIEAVITYQSDAIAGLQHLFEWDSANPLRSCHWEWMASNSCLCQCWGVLSDWASNWMRPMIQIKPCGCWNMGIES